MSNIKTKRRTYRTSKKDILRGAAVLNDLKIMLWEDHYKAVMEKLNKIDDPVQENKLLREALEIREIITRLHKSKINKGERSWN